MSHTALFVVDDCCASLFINCRTEKRPLGLTNDIHGGLNSTNLLHLTRFKVSNCLFNTIKHIKHGLFVLYGQYSTRGEVSRHNKAFGFASCCIGLSTSPLVLYCPYSTPNHALTITYFLSSQVHISNTKHEMNLNL